MESEFEDRAYIDGAWVEAKNQARFEVHNPFDQSLVGKVVDTSVDQIRVAIGAAHRAWPAWRALTAKARGDLLAAMAQAMLDQRDALAELMTREQGKPLSESRGEIEYAAGFLSWAAEEGKRVYGDAIPSSDPNKRLYAWKQPVGVVAAITPWNFPAAMITRKIGPALAAGCTAVVKPATSTPLSALAIAAIADTVGIPAGVLNVVPCQDPEAAGKVLTHDDRVRKITFTGSTGVGKWLVREASGHLPKMSLELGGHAPALVFDDADVQLAVREIMAAKFRNAGQTCVCVNRIYVQRGIAEAFTEAFAEAMASLELGDGLDEATDIGPLISAEGVDKVAEHVADAREHGAQIRLGGERRPDLGPHFFAPTLITNASQDMQVMREETFGPVAPIAVFDTERQAIDLANDTPFGLAAYFFSSDGARCHRVAEGLDYGIVGVNDGRPSTNEAPFGGLKQSGWGREGGKYAMDAYLETKYVSWGLGDGAS